MQKRIAEQSNQLKTVFDKQEKLACLRQELSQLVTEQEYFNQYVEELDVNTESIKFKKKLSLKHWMVLWQECQLISEEEKGIGFWFKIKGFFKYGVTDWIFYKQDISKIITTFQAMYYRAKQVELSAEIADIEKYLNSVNKDLLEDLCNQSMVVLKDKLARKYEANSRRKIFSEDNLWKEPYDVLAEYPVGDAKQLPNQNRIPPNTKLRLFVDLLYIRFPKNESNFHTFCSSKRNLNRAATSRHFFMQKL